ncbi:MAG: hypothetical protein WCR06_05510 [bacterium]
MAGISTMNTTQQDILALLIEQEEWIGQLYKAYQNLFPELDSFWGQLAEEEDGHAGLLKQLAGRMDQATCSFDARKFNTVGLRTSSEHIRKQVQIANTEPVTLVRALATAFDLETGLIEKEFFKVVVVNPAEVQREWQALTEETQAHRKRIAVRLAEERNRSRV